MAVPKKAEVAFGSITSEFIQIIDNAKGRFLQVKNSTNKNVVLQVLQKGGEVAELTLPTQDFSSYMIPQYHDGNVFLKYESIAPTSGSVFIQSVDNDGF